MCKGLRNTPAASQAMSPATRAQVQQGTTFWMGYREGGTPFNTKIYFLQKTKVNTNNEKRFCSRPYFIIVCFIRILYTK